MVSSGGMIMSTSNFNLRNIAPDVMLVLKQEAAKQNTSVNSLILKFIDHELNIKHQVKKNSYHDLDNLAGTWTEKDKKAFEQRIKSFEQIDQDLWA